MAAQVASRTRREPEPLAFRVCATFYAGLLDRDRCRALIEALGRRGARAEAVSRRDLGIVSITFGLPATTAEAAQREAEALLDAAIRDAGHGELAHALSVVRVAR